jgi:hypothetical protein
MKNMPSAGANLRHVYRFARDLGCDIAPIRRTGEDRVMHPLFRPGVKVDARRKDCPRHLSVYLKRVVGAVTQAA